MQMIAMAAVGGRVIGVNSQGLWEYIANKWVLLVHVMSGDSYWLRQQDELIEILQARVEELEKATNIIFDMEWNR